MNTKNTTPHWIIIGLLLAIIGGIAYKFVIVGSVIEGKEERTAVVLTPGERQAVLGEMRMLLATTQVMMEALANEDLKTVEAAARPLGSTAIATVDFALRAKLPLGFKKLGFATHYAFDDIANMAAEGKPTKTIQLVVAQTMNNCIACHSMYELPLIQ